MPTIHADDPRAIALTTAIRAGQFETLQRHLLRHAGGDRVMAQVLAAVPVHGLETVLVAAEIALEAGRPSAEHVLNVLARLKDGAPAIRELTLATPALKEEPRADVQRYDTLRTTQEVRP